MILLFLIAVGGQLCYWLLHREATEEMDDLVFRACLLRDK